MEATLRSLLVMFAAAGLVAGCDVSPEDMSVTRQALTVGQLPPIEPIPISDPPVLRIPPSIKEFRINDQLATTRQCVRAPLVASDPLQQPQLIFEARAYATRLARAELCRDGDCFWSEDLHGSIPASNTVRRHVRDPGLPAFRPTIPLGRTAYTLQVTDENGRRATQRLEMKIGPRNAFELLDTLQVRGPRTGAGTRFFRVHWRGVNVRTVCVGPALVYPDVSACQSVASTDQWGPVERVSNIGLYLTADQARRMADAKRPDWIIARAFSPELDDCFSEESVYEYIDWRSGTPTGSGMEMPETPEPDREPPPPTPDPDRPVSPFPECRWSCDSTSPTGWIRTDARRTFSCGGSSYQFHICRYSDRPVGYMLSVCSSETTPGDWDTLAFSTEILRCGDVPGTSNNVKLIRRRE